MPESDRNPPTDPEAARPLVSVLIPVYNAEKHLVPAIESVFRQTWRNLEIVCVNDGSTDGSGALLDELARRDPRMRVLHTDNRGIVSALNHGLQAAAGTLIARMDADDLCLPERIARQVDYLEKHPDVGVVGCQALRIGEQGMPIRATAFPCAHDAIASQLLDGMCPLTHPAVMMTRTALDQAQGYRPCVAEDYDLFLRLSQMTRLANLDEVLLLYRVSLGGLKHAKLAENHRSVLESLAGLACSGNAGKGDPGSLRARFEQYERSVEDPQQFARRQLETAFRSRNFLTARSLGRHLWKVRGHHRRSRRFWLKAEIASVLGRGNRDQALADRANGTSSSNRTTAPKKSSGSHTRSPA